MNRKKIKMLSVLTVFCILVLLVVSGCSVSSGGGNKVSMTFAHPFEGKQGFEQEYANELQAFAESVKDQAEWSFEVVPGADLRQKMIVDAAADNLPDVFYYWDRTSLRNMVDADKVLDPIEYLNKSTNINKEDFLDWSWNAYTFDGETHIAIPYTGYYEFFMANQAVFDEYNLDIPTTYEELLQVSAVLADNDIVPIAIGSKNGDPAHFLYAELWQQFGDNQNLDKIQTGEYPFDTDLTRKTTDYVIDMVQNRVFPKDTLGSGGYDPTIAMYNEGKAAMILAQTWSIPKFGQSVIDTTVLVPIPKLPDAVHDPSAFTLGGVNNGLVINKKSWQDPDKQKQIIALLDKLLSDEMYSLFIKYGRNNIYKNLQIDTSGLNPPKLFQMVEDFVQGKQISSQFFSAMPYPANKEVFMQGLDQVWSGNMASDDFTSRVQNSIASELEKNK